MKPLAQVPWIASVLFAASAAAICQSTLPPTAPTTREMEEHPAMVEYSDGRIAVVADNSSLNDILRDVARRAGMSVRGSVLDERVFGTYGPAAPAEVLTALLKDTGSNMMVVAGASRVPELVLTPKHGGPTPPKPQPAEQGDHEAAATEAAAESLDPIGAKPETAVAVDKAAISGDAEPKAAEAVSAPEAVDNSPNQPRPIESPQAQ